MQSMKHAKTRRPTQGKNAAKRRPAYSSKFHRSPVAAGLRLLPGMSAHDLGTWGRIMRDVLDRLIQHVGGDDLITETQRHACRRVACLEAELIFLEKKIATKRSEGEEPTQTDLELYGRLASHQRRLADALGWKRVMKDVTPPDPLAYAKSYDEEEAVA